jgi:hypothetical protein
LKVIGLPDGIMKVARPHPAARVRATMRGSWHLAQRE